MTKYPLLIASFLLLTARAEAQESPPAELDKLVRAYADDQMQTLWEANGDLRIVVRDVERTEPDAEGWVCVRFDFVLVERNEPHVFLARLHFGADGAIGLDLDRLDDDRQCAGPWTMVIEGVAPFTPPA